MDLLETLQSLLAKKVKAAIEDLITDIESPQDQEAAQNLVTKEVARVLGLLAAKL
jgi:hypothetical protein